MKKILFTLALLISFSSFGQTCEELFDLGLAEQNKGNHSEAIVLLKKGIELYPNENSVCKNVGICIIGDFNLNIAWSYFKLKDYKNALLYTEKAWQVCKVSNYLEAKAMIYSEMGDVDNECKFGLLALYVEEAYLQHLVLSNEEWAKEGVPIATKRRDELAESYSRCN